MAGKHRNLVHVGRLSQRREIPHLHVLNHALSKWCHHRKLLCEIEFAGISNSIVSQRAFSAKKISDESEITEEWKEVSGRRTTSRSCYYRDSGLVQCVLCLLGARAAQVCRSFSGTICLRPILLPIEYWRCTTMILSHRHVFFPMD